VAGFAVLDNHMHVVLLLNDSVANGWTDEEVVRRWGRLFPPRGKNREALEVTDVWVAFQLKNVKWVEETRRRLNSLGWFMKCLKEPLARMANREDNCKGTFFESRFQSIAILDEKALLTTLAYVDLNPLAAGMAKTPEDSLHTSVKARVDDCRVRGTLGVVVANDALADVANSSDDQAPSSPGAPAFGHLLPRRGGEGTERRGLLISRRAGIGQRRQLNMPTQRKKLPRRGREGTVGM